MSLETLSTALREAGIPADADDAAAFVRAYAWGETLPAEVAVIVGRWWQMAPDDLVRDALRPSAPAWRQ